MHFISLWIPSVVWELHLLISVIPFSIYGMFLWVFFFLMYWGSIAVTDMLRLHILKAEAKIKLPRGQLSKQLHSELQFPSHLKRTAAWHRAESNKTCKLAQLLVWFSEGNCVTHSHVCESERQGCMIRLFIEVVTPEGSGNMKQVHYLFMSSVYWKMLNHHDLHLNVLHVSSQCCRGTQRQAGLMDVLVLAVSESLLRGRYSITD